MNYWIVSPNVTNNSGEEKAWKAAIQKFGIAIMGWGEEDDLGKTFINKVKIGDIILIAQGANWQKKVFLAGKVNSEANEDHLPDTPRAAWCRVLTGLVYKEEIESLNLDFNGAAFGDANQIPAIYQLKPWQNQADKLISNILMSNINNAMARNERKNIIDILLYKKQIILQGPPGTGKTKLAKEIAQEIIGFSKIQPRESFSSLDINKIKRLIFPGQKIKSASNYTEYLIQELGNNNVTVKLKDLETEYKPSYKEIINAYEIKMWEGKQSKGNDPYAAAIAKYIFSQNKSDVHKQEDTEQFKLIQFHPSYSYEDFVRGIVAKPNLDGDSILYDAEEKVLGSFAKLAFENYQISRGGNEKSTQLLQAKTTLQKFVDHVQDELDKTPERKYQISDAVYLFDVDDKRFKYKGDNWKAHEKGLNMKFSELEKIIQAGVTHRSDIKDQNNLESLTKQHATYFFNTLEKYGEFEKSHSTKFSPQDIEQQIKEKNYVLIIDEINRANLSSVLGELIYALEYRGETVESMYTVDGNNELILPPNLYIIGTMNTADRSVGHIDYAIRRRFAFVDLLPKDLTSELGDEFHKTLFDQVADLFATHLSPEFELKDVQLGHSYFIDKTADGGTMPIRLQYEIKPILIEYVKDGILIGDDILQTIMNLSA